ncbi:NAD(P)-dependent oxidoreductase [Oligoflexia bacterium]|nr:NAD(P)-dependent oxidoreductase [Oligoflexia bacterium]
MKKILVTGGNGFVGSHLTETLASKGYAPVVFDLAEQSQNAAPNTLFVQGSLVSAADLSRTPTDLYGIVHLGAISRVRDGVTDPAHCMNVNVMGTTNVLELARTLESKPWVILANTNEVPENIYGLSKHMAELCGERFAKEFDLSVLSLKFSSVYGSSRDNQDKLIPKLIGRALRNDDITLSYAMLKFDFINIRDLINGILLGLEHIADCRGGYFESMPLCSGIPMTLKAVADTIVKASASSSKIVVESGDPMPFVPLDSEKAKKIIKFAAEIDFATGIRQTLSELSH